jgi:hypothetical protein
MYLVGFPPWGKGLLPNSQGDKLLEVLDLRVFVPGFPIPHGAPGDA